MGFKFSPRGDAQRILTAFYFRWPCSTDVTCHAVLIDQTRARIWHASVSSDRDHNATVIRMTIPGRSPCLCPCGPGQPLGRGSPWSPTGTNAVSSPGKLSYRPTVHGDFHMYPADPTQQAFTRGRAPPPPPFYEEMARVKWLALTDKASQADLVFRKRR